jgi:hypothetical protein
MEDGIRFATTDEERDTVFSLRYQIYVKEMGRLGDQADHERGQLRDALDGTARHILAVQDGRPVGIMRIHWGGDAPFAPDLREAYSLDTFADILEDRQICIAERLMLPADLRGNRELTSGLYVFLYRFLVEEGVEIILLDCEPHLINNWLSLGFRPFAPTFTYPGVGLVVPLVGVVWDIDHLKRVGSPLLLALGSRPREGRAGGGAGLVKKVLERLPAPVSRAARSALVRRVRAPGAAEHAPVVERIRERLPEVAPVVSEKIAGADGVLGELYRSIDAAKVGSRPSIFDEMSDEERAQCLRASHVIECKPGDVIIQRGNAARTLFILLDGVVEVHRQGETVAVFTSGAVFGEVAFLLGKPRTADIVAATEGVRVLSLSEGNIRELMARDQRLASKLLLNLCRCMCARLLDD